MSKDDVITVNSRKIIPHPSLDDNLDTIDVNSAKYKYYQRGDVISLYGLSNDVETVIESTLSLEELKKLLLSFL